MLGNRDSGRWIVVAASVALLAPLAVAGKPGGGATPPANPAIVCVVQGRGGATDHSLVVMNADGSNKRTVLDGGTTHLGYADWSPDGKQLVFLSDVQGPGVYVIDVDGTDLRKVTHVNAISTSWWARTPRWSPAATADGAPKVAFVDNPAAGSSGAVYVVNLDGTGRAQLTESVPVPFDGMGANQLSWAGAADRIAVGMYTASNGSVQDVVVHDLEMSGGALAVTSSFNLTDDASVPGGSLNSYNVTSPSWSRTGNRIAVDAQYNVWIIDLANPAAPTRVSPSTTLEQTDPCWSPNDAKLVVSQWHSARCLFTMNADGTNLVEIAHGKAPNGPSYLGATWRRNP